jgi:hypothetical protein
MRCDCNQTQHLHCDKNNRKPFCCMFKSSGGAAVPLATACKLSSATFTVKVYDTF